MSWDNYGAKGWSIDHLKPVSWFDYYTYSCLNFTKCWKLSNLQPKWNTENMEKGNRYEG
jgi:hypothetical protein